MSFLTLGMTADAAAAHRHEFSPTQTPTSPSFFSAIPFIRTQAPECFKITPRRPTIVLEEPEMEEEQQGFGTLVTTTESTTPEEEVIEEQILSPTKQKAPKLKTVYQLGYPPPSQANHRHHLSLLKTKSAPLIQFQRLSNVPRPVPVYDLVPASTASSVTGNKQCLKQFSGSVDLVVVDSEQYDEEEEDAEVTDKERASRRNVVAGLTFKDGKKDAILGMVQLKHGMTWEIKKLSSSGYEFTLVDDIEGSPKRVARWVRRNGSRRRSTHTEGMGESAARPKEERYIFSVLNSESRKHPILASMTKQKLEIFDQFSATSEVLSRPSSPIRNDSWQSSNGSVPSFGSFNEHSERIVGIAPEQLRLLIYATGSWVAMQENFDQRFRGELSIDAASRASSPVTPSRPCSPALLARGVTHLGHPSRVATPSTPTTPSIAQRSNTISAGSGSRIIPRRWTGDFTHQRSASVGIEQTLAALTMPSRDEPIDPPLMSAPLQQPQLYTQTIPIQQTTVQLPLEPQLPQNRHSISFVEPRQLEPAPPPRPVRNSLMGPPPKASEVPVTVDRGMGMGMDRSLGMNMGDGSTPDIETSKGLKRRKSSVKRVLNFFKRKVISSDKS